MSKYTPWEEVVGPSPPPEDLPDVAPAPLPLPVVDIAPLPAPDPIVPPAPPVNPPPVAPTASKSSPWALIAAAVIVVGGMAGTGYFLSKDRPGPTPNVVVPDGPVMPVVDATLSKAFADDNGRGMAASYFRDVSHFIGTSKNLQTTGQVIEAVKAGMKDLQGSIGASGWAAINTPVSNRIIAALGSTPIAGAPDVPLDTPLPNGITPRAALVKEYAQIAVDCRGG